MEAFFEQITSSDLGIKLIGFVIAIQILLLGIGEALTRISKFTKNTWDNDLAKKIAKASWYIGVVVSKFGYSAPELVVKEKAKKIK